MLHVPDQVAPAVEAAPPDRDEPVTPGPPGERRRWTLDRLVLALVLVPVAVSAVALVVGVGDAYLPTSDHALTELQVRDVGRHEVLVGLYSRADWSHPGPALFYLLAPFYRLAGGASIGMNLGALAINGAALGGIVALARRHGGTTLALAVSLALALLVRSLGAEFVHDPWNCFVTVLPFGLVVMLTWAMACGDRWALPVGAAVATGVAQAHVGFVALALPLVAGGAVALAVRRLRAAAPTDELDDPFGHTSDVPAGDADADDSAGDADADAATGEGDHRSPGRLAAARATVRRSGLVRPVLVTVGVLAVLWSPVVVDVVLHSPSNATKIVDWFGEADGGVHSLADGWRTVTGQLGLRAEWLGGKRTSALSGESPFLYTAPVPWLLVPIAVAGVVLWRRGGPGRRLVVTIAATLVLSVAAVARTVGPAFDYRLRWTWVPAALAGAAAAWTAGREIAARRPATRRWLRGGLVAGLVAVTAVNAVTAATAGTPQESDSAVLDALMPAVLDEVADVRGDDGPVVVTDPFANGSWYARGVVLQLERHDVEVAVPAVYGQLFGQRRVADEPGALTLTVAMNSAVAALDDDPDLRPVARWTAVPDDAFARADRQRDQLDDRLADGEITGEQHQYLSTLIDRSLSAHGGATAYIVAVYARDPAEP